MFDGPCDKGDDKCTGEFHEYYFQDRYFDYVCIQPYREKEYASDIVAHLKYTMDFFRSESDMAGLQQLVDDYLAK